jgi:hypothetical protein
LNKKLKNLKKTEKNDDAEKTRKRQETETGPDYRKTQSKNILVLFQFN